MIPFVDAWVPVLEGLLLLALAMEQIYLFKFVFSIFKITRDNNLFFLSFSFFVLLIGSILSSSVGFFAFFHMGLGMPELGFMAMENMGLIFTMFEVVGFGLIFLFPFLMREMESIDFISVFPIFALSVFNAKFLLNLILLFILIELALLLAKNLKKITFINSLLLVGLSILVFSKIIVLLIPMQTVEVMSISFEVVVFSLLILLKEGAATSCADKPLIVKET